MKINCGNKAYNWEELTILSKIIVIILVPVVILWIIPVILISLIGLVLIAILEEVFKFKNGD